MFSFVFLILIRKLWKLKLYSIHRFVPLQTHSWQPFKKSFPKLKLVFSRLVLRISACLPDSVATNLTITTTASRDRKGLVINNSDSWVISVGSSNSSTTFVLQSASVLLCLHVASFCEGCEIPLQKVSSFLLSKPRRPYALCGYGSWFRIPVATMDVIPTLFPLNWGGGALV